VPVEKVMCTITGTSKLLFHVYCCEAASAAEGAENRKSGFQHPLRFLDTVTRSDLQASRGQGHHSGGTLPRVRSSRWCQPRKMGVGTGNCALIILPGCSQDSAANTNHTTRKAQRAKHKAQSTKHKAQSTKHKHKAQSSAS